MTKTDIVLNAGLSLSELNTKNTDEGITYLGVPKTRMPKKQWKKRKSRLRMTNKSRKANRK